MGCFYGRICYNLGLQPRLELGQSESSVGQAVLLRLVHLGVCLAFVLEDRIPTCHRQCLLEVGKGARGAGALADRNWWDLEVTRSCPGSLDQSERKGMLDKGAKITVTRPSKIRGS